MQWQMWTAFGIMMGYVADLAFYRVPDLSGIPGLNWRLMMGSAAIPAVMVCCMVYFFPEVSLMMRPPSLFRKTRLTDGKTSSLKNKKKKSPRWYLTKDRHLEAYHAICKLRYSKIQAARDLFYMHTLLEAERETMDTVGRSYGAKLREIFAVRRNRHACLASEIVMFMQQFCGVNAIACRFSPGENFIYVCVWREREKLMIYFAQITRQRSF